MPKIAIPTNVEIMFKENLEDKLLVQIPRTQFHILGEVIKKNEWKVSLVNLMSSSRRIIGDKITDLDLSLIIARVLSHKEQENFKRSLTMKELLTTYKQLIEDSHNKKLPHKKL